MADEHTISRHLEQFPGQCMHAAKLAREYYIESPEKIQSIVVTGIGTAALPGDLLKSYCNIDRAVYVNRGYSIPEFVDENTLVFVISYSGEDDTTLAAYRSAVAKRAQVICLTSGGKLGQLCRVNNTQQILLPKGIPERLALGYLFIPMLVILENAGFLELGNQIARLVQTLKSPMFKEKGDQLAARLVKKIPLVYTSSKFRSIGLRWRHMLNQNAKVHAFTNEFPDLNYTEINGFMHLNGEYEVIIINEESDFSRVKNHMRAAKELLKKKVRVTEIAITGDSPLSKLLSTIYLGDWTSYCLARRLGINPGGPDYAQKVRQ